MKIIIIEGTDRTGKTSVINDIISTMNNVRLVHCDKPKSKTPEEAAKEQTEEFIHYVWVCKHDYLTGSLKQDAIVFNRFYQGEYVYGQLYRNRTSEDINNMIDEIESDPIFEIARSDIYYIQLLSSSTKLLLKNEDGDSLSQGKVDFMNKERELFEKVYEHSKIMKKKLIYINNGDEFRSHEDIMNEINNFLNN